MKFIGGCHGPRVALSHRVDSRVRHTRKRSRKVSFDVFSRVTETVLKKTNHKVEIRSREIAELENSVGGSSRAVNPRVGL